MKQVILLMQEQNVVGVVVGGVVVGVVWAENGFERNAKKNL